MRGRPKRIRNDAVAMKVDAYRNATGLSDAAIARELGVHPATLCRAVQNSSFSRNLIERINARLPDGEALNARAPESLNDALRLLQDFVKLLPEVRKSLDIVLDLQRNER